MNEALLPSAELPAAQPPSELPEHSAAVQPNLPECLLLLLPSPQLLLQASAHRSTAYRLAH